MLTGLKDWSARDISLRDICVGKTDYRHPMGSQATDFLVEQGVIEKINDKFMWNGHLLTSVFGSIYILSRNPKDLIETDNLNGMVVRKGFKP